MVSRGPGNPNKPVRNARWCRGGRLARCATGPLVRHHEEIITKGKQFEESQQLGLRGCGSRNVREINFANTEHNTKYRVRSWRSKTSRCLSDQPQSLPQSRHQRGGPVGSRGSSPVLSDGATAKGHCRHIQTSSLGLGAHGTLSSTTMPRD